MYLYLNNTTFNSKFYFDFSKMLFRFIEENILPNILKQLFYECGIIIKYILNKCGILH